MPLTPILNTLRTFQAEASPALEQILGTLREVLRARTTIAYAIHVGTDERAVVDFVYADGAPKTMEADTRAYFARAPVPWGQFNPSRPERPQQNRVMTTADLPQDRPVPIREELFPKLGVHEDDQLRVLVCEQGSLLAWVGAFRPEPFGADERKLLASIVPALQERLTLERQLSLSAVHEAAMIAALEALPGAAYVLREGGAIAHANSAAQARLKADRSGVQQTVADALRDAPGTGLHVSRLAAPGLAPHYLAVERGARPTAAGLALQRARRWGLTPRQGDVLALIAEGLSNRAIAARLGCAEGTVEIHVSAILDKADAESRAQLVARVWAQP